MLIGRKYSQDNAKAEVYKYFTETVQAKLVLGVHCLPQRLNFLRKLSFHPNMVQHQEGGGIQHLIPSSLRGGNNV
jgi:hypothetical protein